jgi:hypothetical protein
MMLRIAVPSDTDRAIQSIRSKPADRLRWPPGAIVCSHGWSGLEPCAGRETCPRNPWNIAPSKPFTSTDSVAN